MSDWETAIHRRSFKRDGRMGTGFSVGRHETDEFGGSYWKPIAYVDTRAQAEAIVTALNSGVSQDDRPTLRRIVREATGRL